MFKRSSFPSIINSFIIDSPMIDVTRKVERYYVALKPQTNDFHSVHREGCPFMPDDNKRIYLGIFPTGKEAGEEGKKYFCKSNCCRFCSREASLTEINPVSMPIQSSVGFLCLLN